jgi:LPS sulfotransferase NodH
MSVEKVFNRLSETKLLDKLTQKTKLGFVGDAETTQYLKSFFDPKGKSGYRYFPWQTEFTDNNLDNQLESQQISKCNAVIVASVENESKLFEQVKLYTEKKAIQLPILQLFSDVFVNLMSGRDLLTTPTLETQPPKIAYTIVSTPRSGSTFLCNALQSTQLAGFPDEHLREPSLMLAKDCHFDYVKYLQVLMSYRVTENGVFGTKLISHFLQEHQEINPNFNPATIFDKFIYLIRRDKIAQAVSRFVAEQTNIWDIKKNDKDRQEQYQKKLQQIKIEEPQLGRVHQFFLSLIEEERYLEKMFKQNQISPLVIEYEDVEKDIEGYINKILNYLGITQEGQNIEINLPDRKLRSGLSEEIIQKYKEKYL